MRPYARASCNSDVGGEGGGARHSHAVDRDIGAEANCAGTLCEMRELPGNRHRQILLSLLTYVRARGEDDGNPSLDQKNCLPSVSCNIRVLDHDGVRSLDDRHHASKVRTGNSRWDSPTTDRGESRKKISCGTTHGD